MTGPNPANCNARIRLCPQRLPAARSGRFMPRNAAAPPPGGAGGGPGSGNRRQSGLGLWLGTLRTTAPLGHELVELRLVLGMAQALEEFPEFALLLFEPVQGLRAILVEGAVA